MLSFLIGMCVGGFAGWLFYVSAQRDNSRIEEDKAMLVQEKQIVLRFMHDLVESIGKGGTREELFNYVVRAAVQTTGGLSASVFELRESNELHCAATEGLFPPLKRINKQNLANNETRAGFIARVMRSDVYRVGEGILGTAAECRKGMLISDASQDPRIADIGDPTLSIHTLILSPIVFRDRLIGVLAVANQNDNLPFSETDFSLVESLSEQAGLAIHNLDAMHFQIEKNRLDQDLALANTIQGMLLPHAFPADGRIDIAAVFQPAQMVGGDLYDVIELEHGRIGVAIADVSGKGIPASLLMAICQSNLRHLARSESSPARVLSGLNRIIHYETERNMFVTMIYAVIDLDKSEITLARAGHELPIMLRKDAEKNVFRTEMIASDGMALGMVPPVIFDRAIEEHTIRYQSDEILLLYTDGVTEMRNSRGDEYSSDRLADSLRQARKKSASEINMAIQGSLSGFAATGQMFDDITFLTVKLYSNQGETRPQHFSI